MLDVKKLSEPVISHPTKEQAVERRVHKAALSELVDYLRANPKTGTAEAEAKYREFLEPMLKKG